MSRWLSLVCLGFSPCLFQADGQETPRQPLAAKVPNLTAEPEFRRSLSGQLEVWVVDDFSSGRSETLHRLHTPEGAVELSFPNHRPAGLSCGQRVRVEGLQREKYLTVLHTAAEEAIGSDVLCSTIGAQNTAVLLVTFPGMLVPASPTREEVKDIFFSAEGGSLNEFWKIGSNNQAWATGDVFGWYMLDANYGCEQADQVRAAAIRAAAVDVDFRKYARIFIVSPRPQGACKFSALSTRGCSSLTSPEGEPFVASTSWVIADDLTDRQRGVKLAAHAGGHNLGLGDAGSRHFDADALGATEGQRRELGDLISAMGSGSESYSAAERYRLGWLDEEQIVATETAGEHTLQAGVSSSLGPRALKIRRRVESDEWLWLEYRQPGVVLHYEDQTVRAAASVDLLDFTPDTEALSDAPLAAGTTWTDPYSTLSLKVAAGAPDSVTVTVNYDAPCASISPGSRDHGTESETGVVTINAAPGCSWIAASAAPWIRLRGEISGQGPAALAYVVASNDTVRRAAPLYIARQQFSINQAGVNTPPTPMYVSPSTGVGNMPGFTFSFRDAEGSQDIDLVQMLITAGGTSNACWIQFERAANVFWLMNDTATAWLGPLAFNSGSNLENTQCQLLGNTLGVYGSGTDLQVGIGFRLKVAFAGARYVYAWARDTQQSVSNWVQVGSWNVLPNQPPSTSSNAYSGVGNSASFYFAFSDPNGYPDLALTQFLISGGGVTNACWGQYDRATNLFWLMNDATTNWLGPLTPNQAGSIENSQCKITSTYVYGGYGDSLNYQVNVTFKPVFAGDKTIYAWARDTSNASSSWTKLGTWTVIGSTPVPRSVSPNSGTGNTRTFSFLFSDGDGFASIELAQVLISSGSSINSCWIQYDRTTNRLSLMNDATAAWLGPVILGSNATLENSQCSINVPASTAWTSDIDLNLNVTVNLKVGFSGNKTVYGWVRDVTQAASSWVALGSWTVPGNGSPLPSYVYPASGNGNTQSFDMVFADVNGYSDIALAQILISSGGTTNACWVEYDRAANMLRLMNDSGTSWLGPVFPPDSTVLENSQCRITAVSTYAYSNELRISVAISFKSAFAGNKIVSGWARDVNQAASSWTPLGTWVVPGSQAPVPVLVSPNAGTGNNQTFNFNFTDANGYADISLMQMLITSGGTLNACWVEYDRTLNILRLMNDAGTVWLGPLTPGYTSTIENSQCRINGSGAYVSFYANAISLNITVTFKTAFSGTKTIFGWARDAGQAASSWVGLGSWIVPGSQAPVPNSVSPASGSGNIQTFSASFSDINGYGDISLAQVLISTGGTVNACWIQYESAQNRFWLMNDTATAWLGPVTPGQSSGLQNSQCRFDSSYAYPYASGNSLTLNLPVILTASFIGSKTVYGWARDASLLSSSWTQLGTWVVPGNRSPLPVSVSPNSGSGGTPTFSFYFDDPDGYANIDLTQMIFTTGSITNACWIEYNRTANRFTLMNDSATAWIGPAIPGAQIENSQCRISVTNVYTGGSGTQLLVYVSITFKTGFSGVKSIYGWVRDMASAASNWTALGNWTVP